MVKLKKLPLARNDVGPIENPNLIIFEIFCSESEEQN